MITLALKPWTGIEKIETSPFEAYFLIFTPYKALLKIAQQRHYLFLKNTEVMFEKVMSTFSEKVDNLIQSEKPI